MSRFEDRLAAPPVLPPIRPPRGRGPWEDKPEWEPPEEQPLWRKVSKFEVVSRAGVKFPRSPTDHRQYGAASLQLTTCIVCKVIPPGCRRSARIVGGRGSKYVPKLRKIPRFKTKAESKRLNRRWLNGFARETEYLLVGPGCITFAAARSMMLKTRWTMKMKITFRPPLTAGAS